MNSACLISGEILRGEIAEVGDLSSAISPLNPACRHLERSFPRADVRGVLAVILSAAKDLASLPKRSFAALRMTGLLSKYLRRFLRIERDTYQEGVIRIQDYQT